MNVRGPPASALSSSGISIWPRGPRGTRRDLLDLAQDSRGRRRSRSAAQRPRTPASARLHHPEPQPGRALARWRSRQAALDGAQRGGTVGEPRGQPAGRSPRALPVARQRADRDPLLGPVVAGAGGAELDGRDAGLGGTRRHPRRRRGPPTATRRRPAGRRSRSARARTGSSATRGRREHERPHDVDVGDRADLLEDVAGVLVGQVADVDVHHAGVGHLVERVARRRCARG